MDTLDTITFEPKADTNQPYYVRYYNKNKDTINNRRRENYANVSDEEKQARNLKRRQKYLEKKEAAKAKA